MKKSLVLFSGGIDSTTALYWALKNFEEVTALTFDYGQKHRIEIEMARKIANKLKINHKILRIDLTQIGGSSLTDERIPLPQFEKIEEIREGIPLTYIPFRNGIFLAMASAYAEVQGIKDIVCGFNVIDSPNYPDTRKVFVELMEKAINAGTKASFEDWKFKLHTPLIGMTKAEIIKYGLSLGADYSYSISCYQGNEIPCNKCSSCVIRREAWKTLGIKDHLIERLEKEGKI
ncbi:7-cyano-7-deazaguanine synthase QueC [Candidatus Aminicenantes bacterium AC-335-B20]|jgi:7-cyano-7-deazaguanine synthase|nr:7-cyano-7-deazaguanine synthase QueC [SCandidatus Aminicenantes bacterium Aminicenantia_JdfR_composite]MCP2596785.1 7-cyano-7-deazaguanine synthase QueC [Candidatus Aminicenantes bacterium AC-335-G13]MCP2599046.1 7-cyano-7-deazaguanine synthase QueC [Candidatus Aminicenantes bacterium AC-335-B20]MCP2605571.1 7-cyano-7-deazaguanine synthase QueC [Candidatus Aminicenantes bacterium AC-335-O07]MCP2617891.1 7-cyano-7-deazaguanine synthase QueC [Candidatus Aminicenantes bacterium AC-335-A11]